MMHSLVCSTLSVAMACAAFGQSSAEPVKFEVASVKRGAGGGPPGDIPRNMDSSPGHLAMRNVPLRYCLEWAYDLKDYQISGPDWINFDERYDIVAKTAGPVPEGQVRQMLQSLLTERFQMKTHRESKDFSVYVLVRGKGEPKVKSAEKDVAPSLAANAGTVTFHNQPISRFAFLLTRRLDRPVLDMTGLQGTYDYAVDISGLPVQGRDVSAENTGPSIFTAVQNDLGLKLEARKAPIEVLVIDSVNKVPLEN